MQIICKWGRRDESSVIIFFPVHPIFQNVINFCRDFVSFFRSGFRFFNCLFFFLFPQLGPLEHLAPAIQLLLRRRAHQTCFLVLPGRGSSRPGDPFTLGQILPERKRAFPERVAGKPRKGRAGSSLSGWPQAPSGVPAVLFPFSREDFHRFPVRAQAVSPYRRKTLGAWPMGSQLAKTRSLKGGVRAVLGTWKHSGIELKVIDLGIKTHVVPGKLWRQDKKVRTAHARSKTTKKSKTEDRTPGPSLRR